MQRRVSDKLNFEMSYGGKERGSEENAPFVGKSEKPLGGGNLFFLRFTRAAAGRLEALLSLQRAWGRSKCGAG